MSETIKSDPSYDYIDFLITNTDLDFFEKIDLIFFDKFIK